jgi:hypothetical protein
MLNLRWSSVDELYTGSFLKNGSVLFMVSSVECTGYLDEDCGVEHDENALTAAQELDLFDESEEDKLMFFQIPASLPLSQDAAVSRESDQDEMVGSVKEGTRNSSAGVKLEKLPEGHVGKLLVYKSGAVKLKIGDVLFDVRINFEIESYYMSILFCISE